MMTVALRVLMAADEAGTHGHLATEEIICSSSDSDHL